MTRKRKTTPFFYYCQVCDKRCHDEKTKESHFASSKHKNLMSLEVATTSQGQLSAEFSSNPTVTEVWSTEKTCKLWELSGEKLEKQQQSTQQSADKIQGKMDAQLQQQSVDKIQGQMDAQLQQQSLAMQQKDHKQDGKSIASPKTITVTVTSPNSSGATSSSSLNAAVAKVVVASGENKTALTNLVTSGQPYKGIRRIFTSTVQTSSGVAPHTVKLPLPTALFPKTSQQQLVARAANTAGSVAGNAAVAPTSARQGPTVLTLRGVLPQPPVSTNAQQPTIQPLTSSSATPLGTQFQLIQGPNGQLQVRGPLTSQQLLRMAYGLLTLAIVQNAASQQQIGTQQVQIATIRPGTSSSIAAVSQSGATKLIQLRPQIAAPQQQSVAQQILNQARAVRPVVSPSGVSLQATAVTIPGLVGTTLVTTPVGAALSAGNTPVKVLPPGKQGDGAKQIKTFQTPITTSSEGQAEFPPSPASSPTGLNSSPGSPQQFVLTPAITQIAALQQQGVTVASPNSSAATPSLIEIQKRKSNPSDVLGRVAPTKKTKSGSSVHHQPISRRKPHRLYCVCKKPYDANRLMIGCDICTNWFHVDCLGISDNEAEAMDEYVCMECNKHTTGLSTSPSLN